jgi:hypothetical protein
MQIRLFFYLVIFTLVGCAAPPKVTQSQMEIQAYQSHEFEATKRQAFDSTLSVLQDSGFIIQSADYDSGFITGKGTNDSRYDFWWGATNEHVEMTAFVEQRTSSLSRVRINVVETEQRKSAWNPSQDVIDQEGVRDPKTYQELFEKIDQAIFIKKNL